MSDRAYTNPSDYKVVRMQREGGPAIVVAGGAHVRGLLIELGMRIVEEEPMNLTLDEHLAWLKKEGGSNERLFKVGRIE